ncbi:PWWP domain-containing protein [Mycena kentingensis (nom. inval.)]|nr:PWWP domain-containing protein [Mycena kentingensis (nom. inval.)]
MSAKIGSKKKSKKDEPEATYDIGDLVLGRVRGYPMWPSMSALAAAKGVAYAVRFFPAGDYSWLSAPDLERLTIDDCKKYIEENEAIAAEAKQKNKKDMLEGYKACLDPEAWEKEHDSAPPPKKKGGKKKKKAESDDEEEDEEAVGDDDGEETGSKRKRASKKAAPKKKGGKAKKSKETIESEEDGEGEDAEVKERPSKKSKNEVVDPSVANDPEALKVREWRHKLQKLFLNSTKSMPKDDEMPGVDELFTTIEQYEGMNIEYLTFSKIGKVMRHIHVVPVGQIPRDAEFHFRDRAKALVDRWHQILNANKTEGGSKDGVNGHAGPADGEGDLTMLDDAQAE